MRSHDAQAEADEARRRWDGTVGLLVEVVSSRVPVAEVPLGALETTLQRAVGADGRFHVGEDRGRRYTGADVAGWLTGSAGSSREDGLRRAARAGTEAFARVQQALGEPVVAVSDDRGLARVLLEDALDVDPGDRRRRSPIGRRGRVPAAAD